MKVNDTLGNTQDIRGPAKYIPSSFLAPVMAPAGTSVLTRILEALGRSVVVGVRWIAERQARHEMWLELQRMSDDTLKDFGISRRGIDAAVDAAMAKRRAWHTRQFVDLARPQGMRKAANDDNVTQAA